MISGSGKSVKIVFNLTSVKLNNITADRLILIVKAHTNNKTIVISLITRANEHLQIM